MARRKYDIIRGMKSRRKDLKIPYGVSDFRTIRNEGLYYVDKTRHLSMMEARDRFIFFVRPRRFGKSLFISMLESYYDLNQKKDFKKLFGGLWIGSHPTENANRFMTLKLDFSRSAEPARRWNMRSRRISGSSSTTWSNAIQPVSTGDSGHHSPGSPRPTSWRTL